MGMLSYLGFIMSKTKMGRGILFVLSCLNVALLYVGLLTSVVRWKHSSQRPNINLLQNKIYVQLFHFHKNCPNYRRNCVFDNQVQIHRTSNLPVRSDSYFHNMHTTNVHTKRSVLVIAVIAVIIIILTAHTHTHIHIHK